MKKFDKKRQFDKKGQIENLLANVLRIGFMIAAITIFFLMVNYYVNNKIDTQRLQEETMLNRILYSDLIMYQDPATLRVYPGIVDIKKFDNEYLNDAINYGEFQRHVAVKIKLLRKIPLSGNPDLFVKDVYINKNQFDEWNQIVNIPGKGSATKYITQLPVSFIDGNYQGKHDYGTLIIEIIVPNS